MARRPATLALLLFTLFTAARSAPVLAAPPSGRREPTRTILRFSNYRVLFDRVQQGYPTCGASFLYRKGTLELIFLRPTEDGRGQETFLTRSDDLGKTWSDPVSFGPPVGDPKKLYRNASLVGVTARGTSLVTSSFTPRIPGRGYGSTWRPRDMAVGRRLGGTTGFEWKRYDSGTFLGEQFVGTGIVTRSGRIVVAIYGGAEKGQNWQCGVLLSDDEGRSWSYRRVGYEPDRSLRDRPEQPVGYNEQTLFEAEDGTLVSLIRGRQKLGLLIDAHPREICYSRSVSKDDGETWSRPELTNLPGTAGPGVGLVLPDGSLLTAVRVPHHVRSTWIEPPDPALYGMHFARSFDLGKTWVTERIVQQNADGTEFAHYYNVVNGQFVRLQEDRWMFGFGNCDDKGNRHRILATDVFAE